MGASTTAGALLATGYRVKGSEKKGMASPPRSPSSLVQSLPRGSRAASARHSLTVCVYPPHRPSTRCEPVVRQALPIQVVACSTGGLTHSLPMQRKAEPVLPVRFLYMRNGYRHQSSQSRGLATAASARGDTYIREEMRMASTTPGTTAQRTDRDRRNGTDHRSPKWLSATETRRSFITSEFWLALGMAALLVIVGYADDDGLGITRAWELAAGSHRPLHPQSGHRQGRLPRPADPRSGRSSITDTREGSTSARRPFVRALGRRDSRGAGLSRRWSTRLRRRGQTSLLDVS